MRAKGHEEDGQESKFVYAFGGGSAEGGGGQKNLLGGKGANLAEMARLGLSCPPGFTITTEVCIHYYAAQTKLSQRLGTGGRVPPRAGRKSSSGASSETSRTR